MDRRHERIKLKIKLPELIKVCKVFYIIRRFIFIVMTGFSN